MTENGRKPAFRFLRLVKRRKEYDSAAASGAARAARLECALRGAAQERAGRRLGRGADQSGASDRGAAGGAVLCAETLTAKGFITKK